MPTTIAAFAKAGHGHWRMHLSFEDGLNGCLFAALLRIGSCRTAAHCASVEDAAT